MNSTKAVLTAVLIAGSASCDAAPGGGPTPDNDGESASAPTPAVAQTGLTENDHYQALFDESACTSLSDDQVARILDVPADRLRRQANSNQDQIRCAWGYYPNGSHGWEWTSSPR